MREMELTCHSQARPSSLTGRTWLTNVEREGGADNGQDQGGNFRYRLRDCLSLDLPLRDLYSIFHLGFRLSRAAPNDLRQITP